MEVKKPNHPDRSLETIIVLGLMYAETGGPVEMEFMHNGVLVKIVFDKNDITYRNPLQPRV